MQQTWTHMQRDMLKTRESIHWSLCSSEGDKHGRSVWKGFAEHLDAGPSNHGQPMQLHFASADLHDHADAEELAHFHGPGK